jgi:hypothetical protein
VCITYQQPKSNLEREINTLRINKLANSFFKRKNRLIRNNSFLGKPTVDFFAPNQQKFGNARVDKAIANTIHALRLQGQQAHILQGIKCMLAGILCIARPRGVGKSQIIVAISIYSYLLNAENLTTNHSGSV